jgi:cell wall assembly regulator SMI1
MTSPSSGEVEIWAESWSRLCSVTDEYYPDFRKSLAPGASEARIAGLERHLGLTLHPEHKFILQQANGCKDGGALTIGASRLLSCDEIANAFDNWIETVGDANFDGPIEVPAAVKSDRCWQKEWVFFWGDVAMDGIVVDLCPTESGNAGQVFFVGHEFEHSSIYANSPMALVDRLCDEIPKQFLNGTNMGIVTLR